MDDFLGKLSMLFRRFRLQTPDLAIWPVLFQSSNLTSACYDDPTGVRNHWWIGMFHIFWENWETEMLLAARWPSQTSSNLVMLAWSSVFSSPPVLGSTCATLSLISLIFSWEADHTTDRWIDLAIEGTSSRTLFVGWIWIVVAFSTLHKNQTLPSGILRPQRKNSMAFGLYQR